MSFKVIFAPDKLLSFWYTTSIWLQGKNLMKSLSFKFETLLENGLNNDITALFGNKSVKLSPTPNKITGYKSATRFIHTKNQPQKSTFIDGSGVIYDIKYSSKPLSIPFATIPEFQISVSKRYHGTSLRLTSRITMGVVRGWRLLPLAP